MLVIVGLAGCGDSSVATAKRAPSASAVSSWTKLKITDVEGATFTIAGLKGKPVFVENFATWCSNCRKQLGDTQRAAAAAGNAAVFVALSVETDLDPARVAAYAKEHGFVDIRFAVMTPEFLAATSDAFGTSALNPPSTPKVVVDAAGRPAAMVTGFESPAEIEAKLTAAS